MSGPLVLQARRKRGRLVVVANPIGAGFSVRTVRANITELRRAGYKLNQAVAISLQSARAHFRQRYPRRALPDHLKAPRRQSWIDEHGKRTRKKKAVASRRRRRNPATDAELAAADESYRSFHWDEPPDAVVETQCASPEQGDVVTQLGTLEAVHYGASKGGEDAIWEHPFENPKPVLATTEQGELVICGGKYKVNRRGIVG